MNRFQAWLLGHQWIEIQLLNNNTNSGMGENITITTQIRYCHFSPWHELNISDHHTHIGLDLEFIVRISNLKRVWVRFLHNIFPRRGLNYTDHVIYEQPNILRTIWKKGK